MQVTNYRVYGYDRNSEMGRCRIAHSNYLQWLGLFHLAIHKFINLCS
jgi:hypothetical protein